MLEGLDCSYYQGQISWAKVAKAGKRFAIIRSGDGKFLDPKFGPYIRGALDNGLHVTIYHYLRFGLDPESHADLCARRLQEAQELGARDFLWLDWEDTSAHCKAMTVLQRQWWASEFLDSLEKNNDVSTYGHYTGMWWFNPYLGHPDIILPYLARQFFSHPLWIGQYPSMGGCLSDPTAKGLKPTLPKDWTDWQVWQYTSSGRVDGIEGNIDLDIAREGFLDLKEEDMDENQVRQIVRDETAKQTNWIRGFILTMRDLLGPLAEWPLSDEEKEDAARQQRETAKWDDIDNAQMKWRGY